MMDIQFFSQCGTRYEDNGCGAACLLMLLATSGVEDDQCPDSVEQMAERLRINTLPLEKWGDAYEDFGLAIYAIDIIHYLTKEGISHLSIIDDEAKKGNETKRALEWIIDQGFPVMVGMYDKKNHKKWGKGGHWIVVQKPKDGELHYFDPLDASERRHAISICDLKKDWDGMAVVVYPSDDLFQNMESKGDDMDVIKKAFNTGMKEYSDALNRVYPAGNEGYPLERNLSFYLGVALMQSNYLIFHEVPISTKQRKSGWIDTVAISEETDHCILIEAKRIWDKDEVISINDDIDRMQNAFSSKAWPGGLGICGPDKEPSEVTGIIITQTDKKDIRELWKNNDKSVRKTNPCWDKLTDHLNKAWKPDEQFLYNYENSDLQLYSLMAVFRLHPNQ